MNGGIQCLCSCISEAGLRPKPSNAHMITAGRNCGLLCNNIVRDSLTCKQNGGLVLQCYGATLEVL